MVRRICTDDGNIDGNIDLVYFFVFYDDFYYYHYCYYDDDGGGDLTWILLSFSFLYLYSFAC